MKENKYTISEAAKLLSVENHVLRYWEEELELNIPRNELGHRYYREEEIQLLHCIKELKNKGFQLKAVKEVLPDLEQKKLIDIHKLLTTQEELENQELEEAQRERDSQREREMQYGKNKQREREQKEKADHHFSKENDRNAFENNTNSKRNNGSDKNSNRNRTSTANNENETGKEDRTCKVVAIHQNESAALAQHEEKMQQFEEIMGRIVGKALREQAENLGDAMGNHLCNKMLREVDELMVEQEQREEERYKKLDEAIRSTQKARQEIAVSKDGIFKKKSRFFRKNKRKGI